MAVVREDVVKLGFEFDSRGMNQANSAMDDLVDKTQELGGRNGTGKAEDGFENATKAAEKFGKVNLGKLSDGIDKIVDGVGRFALKIGTATAKTVAAGAAVATAGIAALGTQAIKSYAEYEQLVGGVDTLFGESASYDEFAKGVSKSTDSIKEFQRANGLKVDGIIGPETTAAMQKYYREFGRDAATAADVVLKNANDAYKTAGLSANDYMSTVTSFSASLINSLGGDTMKAAEMADMAIIDMADNANKMGTDMASIQNAYQGFAKQNYTMLDNLKLGYGGTKEEMQRLLKDAEKLTGKKYDLSNYADIVEAIHAIQEEMGITGTTAKEASETIQGSALAMKAAWQNFVTGMADDEADFDQLLDNLLNSVQTFLKNIIPRIKKMLPRLVRGLTEIAKEIGKELPGIMDDLLPALVEGAADLLGSMWNVLKSNAGTFKTIGLSIIKAIYKGFTGEEMPEGMLNTIKGKIDEVVEAVGKIMSGLADFCTKLMQAIGPALLWIADVAVVAFCWIGENIDWLLPILGSLLGAMLAFKAVKKVTSIVQGFMGLFSLGGKGGGTAGEAADGALGGGKGGLGAFNYKSVASAMGGIATAIGGIAAIVAAFAALKQIPGYDEFMADGGDAMKQLCDIIADIGLVGAAFVGFTALVGKATSIPEAADGIGSIAIALLGMEAIVAAFATLAQIPGYTDFMADGGTAMKQLCDIITDIGLVGAAFVTFVSLVGTFGGIATAGSGMLAVAAALGGMEAVVLAFGAIAEIPGIDKFMQQGGEMLANLCGIIGEMAGSIIGGIGEGIANSLPDIGNNISEFAASLEPAASTFAGMNFDGLKSFASAFGEFVLVMTGDAIASWFTGGVDYAELALNLRQLATAAPAFTAIQDIPDAAFAKASALFECLAGIKSLPQDGGVVGWFMGEVNFSKIASGIHTLASADMISALTAISSIPETAFTALTGMFDALAGIKKMPSEGGIFDWFTGSDSKGLANVANELPGVATNIALFFAALGGRTDFNPISNLFNTLSNIEINTDVAEKGFWSGVSQLGSMGTELTTFATNAAGFFSAVSNYSGTAISDFFNALGTGGELPAKMAELDGAVGTTLSNTVITVGTKLTEIKKKIETEVKAMIATIKLKQTEFYNSGVHIMQGLNSGINSMRSTLIATARGIANSIRSTINSAMDINSPSRVAFEIGQYWDMGMIGGMQSMIPDIKGTATEVGNATIPYGGTYTPEGSATYYSSGGNSEITTISPVFNLTVSGTQDDRATARRIKRYVAEAITETFESMERTGHLSLV